MKTALLISAITPMSFISAITPMSSAHTALVHFSRDAQHQSLGHCSRSLHQCCSVKQDENSPAYQCNHTYEFLQLTQLWCILAEMHSTKAWDTVHAHCTSAAL